MLRNKKDGVQIGEKYVCKFFIHCFIQISLVLFVSLCHFVPDLSHFDPIDTRTLFGCLFGFLCRFNSITVKNVLTIFNNFF